MIRAEGLSLHRNDKCVLHAIDLTLEPGKVLGVLGPNGAGKSSLLGALCGELRASSGLMASHCRTGAVSSGHDGWQYCRKAPR